MLAAALLIAGPSWSTAIADEPVALTILAVRPEEQGRQLLDLFRGAAPNPAAALAAWKNATGGKVALGKPLEAAIAVLNPAMIGELKGLEGAEAAFRFVPPSWRAVVPHDDAASRP